MKLIALIVAPVLCAFLWLTLWSDRICFLLLFNMLCERFSCVESFFFFKFMPAVFNCVKASRDLWGLLLTCDNVHIQTHIWGWGEVWARYNIKTNLLHTCTNKCMHDSFFKMRKEWASPILSWAVYVSQISNMSLQELRQKKQRQGKTNYCQTRYSRSTKTKTPTLTPTGQCSLISAAQ